MRIDAHPRLYFEFPGNKCLNVRGTQREYSAKPLKRSILGCVQTDETTSNIVVPTMLGVVACVLAVVCKQIQQLATMLGPALHHGKDTTHSLCKPCVMSVRGHNNVARAVQTDPTLLRYASAAITQQKKCWELLAEKFDQFQTLRNNIQQHATGCANGRYM